ncbi:hypothetical protein [Moritella sp. F3]|uniref:hypothetical protein n=1 Tax=Moritella sp. F3 TaxID=2718882 RepID=UPI0018E192A2|nr:hypothetical protein [Moritella sp. F3]GIC75473.1 hypothetical protein FMO001_02000 [Moritella sp. F1]GIC80618.1 hypothetical protein FMO003_08990 [Moritella sp. F3]
MVIDPVEQFRTVIKGNVEGLEQGITLLSTMTNEQYCMRAVPHMNSCIGEHLRHILDLYYALKESAAIQVIDYDVRRRGALVESCRLTGLLELGQIKAWLLTLQPRMMHDKFIMSTEVSVINTTVAHVETSLIRELIFVSAHAIHHYALMDISAKLCAFDTPKNMGIAPATLTALRNDSSCVQ